MGISHPVNLKIPRNILAVVLQYRKKHLAVSSIAGGNDQDFSNPALFHMRLGVKHYFAAIFAVEYSRSLR